MKIHNRMRLTLLIILLLNTACSNSPTEAGQTVPAEISLEKKIGQMLLTGFRGMSVTETDTIVRHIRAGRVGGIILFDYDVINKEFKRNIESPEQVENLIRDLNAHADAPLLMSIDQEGGKVLRLKPGKGFPDIPSAFQLGQMGNLDSTRHYARLNAQNLAALGFNVNFAPVVDLDVRRNTGVIGKYERSFSNDPDSVVAHAQVVIAAHLASGVIPVMKHFPGHGSSEDDSHLGLTEVTGTWGESELEPYRRLIRAGYSGGVMTAHVFNRHLDADYPATLSPKIIQILREDMAFEGVIFSDDMQMKAITAEFGLETAIVRCINSGVDILCFGNNLGYDAEIPRKFQGIVLKAIAEGRISRERIDESYERILAMKAGLQDR